MRARGELFYSAILGDSPGVARPVERAVMADWTERKLPGIRTRDGVALFHRDWGSGRPILFVHSLSLSSAMWGCQESFFCDHGFRCVSFDRRGHGRSGQSAPTHELNVFADDLRAVMDGLDLRNAVLVGHSVGCGEIIRYVARHGSQRVAKIVLLAPATPFVTQTADNPHGAPAAYFEKMRAAWGADYPRWLQENKSPFFIAGTSPAMMDWIEREMLKTPVATAIAYHRAYTATDLRPDLAKMQRPVLILHGDKDVSAPLETTGRRTALGIPGAILKVYPDAPHGLFVTHMDQVNRDILKFIDS
jgi:non-heme chloroperoxidase